MASKGKKKLTPFFGGKGGSDQTDNTLRGGEESSKETLDQISES